MRNRVATWTVVVPVKSRAHVVGDTDVVARRVGVASNDVDDPFFDSVHAPYRRMDQTSVALARFDAEKSEVRTFGYVASNWIWKKMQAARAGAKRRPSRSSHVGEKQREVRLRPFEAPARHRAIARLNSPRAEADGSAKWIRTHSAHRGVGVSPSNVFDQPALVTM
jgi:hypothetical protein